VPQKIYEFFISKWCDMVHSGCVEGKKLKHLSKYWGVLDPCNPRGVDAYAGVCRVSVISQAVGVGLLQVRIQRTLSLSQCSVIASTKGSFTAYLLN